MSGTKFNERLMRSHGNYRWFNGVTGVALSPIFTDKDAALGYREGDCFEMYLKSREIEEANCPEAVVICDKPTDNGTHFYTNVEHGIWGKVIAEDGISPYEHLTNAIETDKENLQRLKQIYE
jgi:hypothetical protein